MKDNLSPKVTIVIPVYNGSNYLAEAIDSALDQTYDNIEVVVVNDGSGDKGKTEEIALSYGDKIRYFSKENNGVASALNMGIREMTGEYFSWLSHDDVYYPHKVESQIKRLASEAKDVVLYSDYDTIDGESRFKRHVENKHVEPHCFRYALTISHPLHGCTALVPKALFDRFGLFDESLRTTQDYDMWFRLSKEVDFIHMKEALIQSRDHAEQGIHTMGKLHRAECNEILGSFIKELSRKELACSGGSVGATYAGVANNFAGRGFYRAARTAVKLYLLNFLGLAPKS